MGETVELFCFPHAGASSVMYWGWKKHLNPGIRVHPVELAGRGMRHATPFYRTFEEAVDDLYSRMRPHIVHGQYAMFGHSLGSLIVYAIAERIKQEQAPPPLHLFFSGRSAPHVAQNPFSRPLSDADVIDRVMRYGGTPADVFQDRSLYTTFVPVLRADFELLETFHYSPRKGKYDCPITVFAGTEDPLVTDDGLKGYADYTNNTCAIHRVNGGHFYLREHTEEVVHVLSEILLNQVSV